MQASGAGWLMGAWSRGNNKEERSRQPGVTTPTSRPLALLRQNSPGSAQLLEVVEGR